MLFQPFKKATRPETPGYVDAEIRRADHEMRAKSRENAMRSQNLSGAAEVYGEATAPGSPISDYLMTQEAAPVYDPTGGAGVGVTPEAQALHGYQASVAPEFASAGASAEGAGAAVESGVSAAELAAASEGAATLGAEAAASAAATEAAAAGATAAELAAIEAAAASAATGASAAGGAAAGTGALAAMGPVGWAALAALALSAASA